MKKLLIFACLFCLCGNAEAQMITRGSGGSASCQETSFQGSLSYNNEWDYAINYDAQEYYRGLIFTASATKNVCKIEAVINVVSGTVSSYNYVARLWSYGSTENLVTQIGASTAVTGITGGPSTYTFTFASPVSITSGTQYKLTIDRGASSTSNYAALAGNSATIANWGMDRWDSTGESAGVSDSIDPAVRLFAYE